MLMALGCATITTFLVLRTWLLFRTRDLSFYRFSLKSAGRIQFAGLVFTAFTIVWVGLNVHSGWVRYHEYKGSLAFQRLEIADELALAQLHPDAWLTGIDRENIVAGRQHLQVASDLGLFTNDEARPKLAWFEYLAGDAEKSVELLAQTAPRQHGQAKALSLYYRGAILNRMGRHEQAVSSLDTALAERPDLIIAREEKGESLWQLGRKSEAISVWSDAVQRNPQLVLANNQLAGALSSLSRVKEAIAHEEQADRYTPDDPFYHWMIGLRLSNLGMIQLAEKHFQRAIQLDPSFQVRRMKSTQ